MKTKFFTPRWGYEHLPWESFLASVKEAGYDGIEWFPFAEGGDYTEVLNLLEKYNLQFSIVMAVLQPIEKSEDYVVELRKQLLTLCALKTPTKAPLFISAQTGREYYSREEVFACLGCCEEVSQQTGIPIYQETHRNKWSYAVHAVAPVLQSRPELRLTLDISHWFCVSESYLADQQAGVQKAIEQARHIHARVGFTEGPQVYDPALPEYGEALAEHLKVWDQWIAGMRESGAAWCSITPEFGPAPYLVTAGRSEPADKAQWRINLWMKELLQKRYAND
ncbi:MAG: sugar phosphate isomerase/epimerase [Bacteroidota bacterium]|nr:sugar phosphate isomerase/epimerase [Bacteroidota bacterium]